MNKNNTYVQIVQKNIFVLNMCKNIKIYINFFKKLISVLIYKLKYRHV